MSDLEESISQFANITGVSNERAKFYLESANGQLQLALTSFYENEQEDIDPIVVADDEPEPKPKETRSENTLGFSTGSGGAGSGGSDSKAKPKVPKEKPRVTTLHNMERSSSEDEEQGQAFCAGGSERSGQQVLGPPRRNPMRDYVSEVFRSAQENGAEVVERSMPSGQSAFVGTGYRLGQTNDDHIAFPSSARNTRSNSETVILKLWRQGFSINDGDYRPCDEPTNKEFLESILRGEIPAELREFGSMVNLDLEDHRNEEFPKSGKKVKAFSGVGHTLGSPAPSITPTSPTDGTLGAVQSSSSKPEDNENQAKEQLKVDSSQPTTMIQIRLSDGSRLAAQFNHSHTVSDIRQYIQAARPQYASQNYLLLTTFPNKELTDDSATIQSAGLLNAAILQRLK